MARASVFLSCRPGLRGHGLRGHGLDTTTKPTSRVFLEVCKQLFECHPVVSARVLFGEQGRCAVPFSDLICHKAAGQCQRRGAVQGGPVHPAGRGSTPLERRGGPNFRFEVKCGASHVLRSPGDTRYPGLEGLQGGVLGSRGQPGVGASLPTGCQGHGGRAAGKARPLRCGDQGSAAWCSGCQSGLVPLCPGQLGAASPGA